MLFKILELIIYEQLIFDVFGVMGNYPSTLCSLAA